MYTANKWPFRYVTPPISTDCLTKGKNYRVVRFDTNTDTSSLGYGWGFYLEDDFERTVYCLERKCSLIGEQDWIIVDYEVNLKKILE